MSCPRGRDVTQSHGKELRIRSRSAWFYLLNISRLTVQGAVLGKPPAPGCDLGLPWGPTQDTQGHDQCHTYRRFTHVAGPSGSWAQKVPLGPCQHPDSPMLPQVPCAGDVSWASPSYGLSPTHGTATQTDGGRETCRSGPALSQAEQKI